MATMEDLKVQVAKNTQLEASAVTLIKGIAKKLADLIAAGADPVALEALVTELNTSAVPLADAVVENT